jgi:hypothetical protein
MKAREDFIPLVELEPKLEVLKRVLDMNDVGMIREMMIRMVAGYTPGDEIVDWVYMHQGAEAEILQLAEN